MSQDFNIQIPEVNISSLATTAAIGGALIGASYLVKNSFRYSGGPPGPRRIPILGNIEFTPEDGGDFNTALQKLCKKYGPIMCMYIGNKPIIVISEYAALREAFLVKGLDFAGRPDSPLISHYNPGYPFTKGIIDSDYSDEWKKQRHTALTILRNLGWGKSVIEKRIQEESSVLLEELDNTKGQPVDPVSLIETCVANIICSLLFGERYEHGDVELQVLLKSVDGLLTAFAQEPGSDYIPLMKLTPAYSRVQKALNEAGGNLVGFYKKKIQEAKDRIARGEDTEDFVTLYLKELEKTEEVESQIKEDWTIQIVSDFFVAGAETSATTLRWAALYMANNQEVQDKVFNEINTNVGKNDIIFLQDREKLPYTEATIMEIQRISALAPIGAPHKTLVDTTVAGYVIPRDTEVWGNLYGVLRDPRQFPEPEKFKPERFLSDNLNSLVKREQWVPFSVGRRTCLGEQLARQELFIFFTNIIRSFKLLPPEGQEHIEFKEIFKFVMKPSEHKLRFIKRS